MLWLAASFFFLWLLYREFRLRAVPRRGYDHPVSTPVSKPYAAALLALALLFAWTPIKYWRFERLLTAKANVLTEGPRAHVHCNTIFDTFFDHNSLFAGHADFETGRIVLQHPWCGRLMDYLDDPVRPGRNELFSLQLFTHEVMHVRGERNEARTECQAVQRNHRTAMLLGVSEAQARESAVRIYREHYKLRADHGPMSRSYYSDECAPGGAMDERLADSIWAVR